MIQEIKYKIVRLNTGEDIVGACLIDEENSCVNIENPMRIMIKRSAGSSKTMLVMMPWLPVEIVEEDFASINYHDIVTMIEPKFSFVEYYISMVEEFQARIMLEEKIQKEEIEDDEEIDEETMQDMLDALKETKKGRLH